MSDKNSPLTTAQLWKNSKLEASLGNSGPSPGDPNFSPPANSVKLPSRGVTYPPESPLFGLEYVDIKSISAPEEDILGSINLIKKNTVLDVLLRACILNRTIDPAKMLVGDRNAILTSIRISAYGPDYTVEISCPECDEETEYTFDLSRLNLKMLDTTPIGGPGNNVFAFTTSNQNIIHFRLFDYETLSTMDKDIEALKKKTGNDRPITMRLYTQIIAVDNKNDPESIKKFIENFPAKDSKAFRRYVDSINPGVDMRQHFECPNCSHAEEVEIPLGPSFFWPS